MVSTALATWWTPQESTYAGGFLHAYTRRLPGALVAAWGPLRRQIVTQLSARSQECPKNLASTHPTERLRAQGRVTPDTRRRNPSEASASSGAVQGVVAGKASTPSSDGPAGTAGFDEQLHFLR